MKSVGRAFFRYLFRRPAFTLLQFFGIACGVAAAVGISLSARAAFKSFSAGVEFLRGQATHSLTRPAGTMDESVLAELARDPAVEVFSPVIDRRLRLENGEIVRLLGIDPLLDRNMRPAFVSAVLARGKARGFEDGLSFLLDEGAVLADAVLAERFGLRPDDEIRTVRGRFRLAGVFPNPSGEPILLMDISRAQALFGLSGRLDRIDLVLDDAPGFEARWKTGYRLETGIERRAVLAQMLRAFRLNLEALSLLALFVGIFLIYNTAMFAVVSRKRDAGILRSLGAYRSEIGAAFLAETLVLGSAGGFCGGILGYLLSRFLAGDVAGAINDLYFFLRPAPPEWSPWIAAAGGLLGGAAAFLGSLRPMIELQRTDPVQAVSGRVADRTGHRTARRLAGAGLALIALSLSVFLLFPTQVYAGFVGAFGFLVGASLLTGLAEVAVYPFLKNGSARIAGLPGKIAAGNVHLNLGRTAVAVASFMVALSMSIGLATMIGSFRRSVERWLDAQLSGDFYLSSMDNADVPVSLYEELRRTPGIAGVDPYRSVLVSYQGASVYASAVDASVLQKFTNFRFFSGRAENWDRVGAGDVLVSESFARRFGVGAGETIVLEGVHGPVPLRVAAVFYDYTSEHGVVMMDRRRFLELYEDPAIDSLGIFFAPGEPRRAAILADVSRRAKEFDLSAFTRDELHANALRVFDATFAVTRSMRLIAVMVAFFGIAGAILTLFLERRREFGIYRALGFSTGQVAGMTLLEGLIMSFLSFLLSLGVGTAMAAILIKVINVRSFNWTVFFSPTAVPYLLALATALLAGLGGSLYPIYKAWRTYPQMQIREE